jgi:hypothetical protein
VKKLFAIAAVCLISLGANVATADQAFEFGTGIKFVSERVAHGCKCCGKAVYPSVVLGYRVSDDLKLSFSLDAIAALEEKYGRMSPCIGVSHNIGDILTVDGGYTLYFYLTSDSQKHSNEIYGGVTANVFLSPSIYAFYDFNNEDFSVETKILHKFDLSDRTVPGMGVELGAQIGYERAEKCSGKHIADGERKYFFYCGVGADLTYDISDNAKAKVGVAYEGNSAQKKSWATGSDRNFVWVRASADCSF